MSRFPERLAEKESKGSFAEVKIPAGIFAGLALNKIQTVIRIGWSAILQSLPLRRLRGVNSAAAIIFAFGITR